MAKEDNSTDLVVFGDTVVWMDKAYDEIVRTASEEIAGVGYINADKEHVLIAIRNPTITSEVPKPTCAQVVITMDNARELEKLLNDFISTHDAFGKAAYPKCVITPKQAEERGISFGDPGYVWVDDIPEGTFVADDH